MSYYYENQNPTVKVKPRKTPVMPEVKEPRAVEEVKVDNIEQVYKLNELGYIKPLTYEQLVLIERKIKDVSLNNEARKNDFDGY